MSTSPPFMKSMRNQLLVAINQNKLANAQAQVHKSNAARKPRLPLSTTSPDLAMRVSVAAAAVSHGWHEHEDWKASENKYLVERLGAEGLSETEDPIGYALRWQVSRRSGRALGAPRDDGG